jgi:hypothetical protein
MDIEDIHDIIIHLIGGGLIVLFGQLLLFLFKKFKYFSFKRFFGQDLENFKIIYGRMILKQNIIQADPFPYIQPLTGASII